MRADETPLFVRWLYEHKDVNLFDATPFRKNQVKIYVAEDESGILNFIPVHLVFHFGSLAPRPDLEPYKQVKCFQAMQEYMLAEAQKNNMSYMFVVPSDVQFADFLEEMKWEYEPKTMKLNVNKAEQCV